MALAGGRQLPDGRAYEQVSEQKKNGSAAGVVFNVAFVEGHEVVTVTSRYAAASPEGDRIVYYITGPSGQTASGAEEYALADRTSEGWSSQAVLPPGYGNQAANFAGEEAKLFSASPDLTRFLFDAVGSFQRENPDEGESEGMYRAGEQDPLSTLPGDPPEAEWWITRPELKPSEAEPEPGHISNTKPILAGASPNLSTVYFTWLAKLVKEDEGRAQNFFVFEKQPRLGPAGFYEWHEGSLHSAGVLPNEPGEPYYDPTRGPNEGVEDPWGAVAAGEAGDGHSGQPVYPFQAEQGNQVSTSGDDALFVSPQPQYASQAKTPVEIYMRQQTPSGPRTLLVSRDELQGGIPAPEVGEQPAVIAETGPNGAPQYAFAAPDGSRVFFQSMDKLAKSAEGAEPQGSGPWTYEFATPSAQAGAGTLTYLPGLAGQILASAKNGSSLLFLQSETVMIEEEEVGFRSEECEEPKLREVQVTTGIARWGEGHVEQLANWRGEVPSKVCIGEGRAAEAEHISEVLPGVPSFARATADGSAFLFAARNRLEGAASSFNDTTGAEQLYLYDTDTKSLRCVSCAPAGSDSLEAQWEKSDVTIPDDGRRVFFATASKLLLGAINGVENVYEWEQAGTGSCAVEEPGGEGGCRYLISSGTSPAPSFYEGSDESGDNVFFATEEGLIPADADGSYDVYDARVGGGFSPPPAPQQCRSDCRSAVPPPVLAPPLSVAIGPSGNLVPPAKTTAPGRKSKSKQKANARRQKLVRALKRCRKKLKRKRAQCKRRARERYGAAEKANGHGGRTAAAGIGGRR